MIDGEDRGSTTLHKVWDTGIIRTRIQRDFNNDTELYIHYLLQSLNTSWVVQRFQWLSCGRSMECSDYWVQESAALACATAYRHPNGTLIDWQAPFNLSEGYYLTNLPVVELRLLQAGVRIAYFLNQLGNPDPPPPTHDVIQARREKEEDTKGMVAFLIVPILLALVGIVVVMLYRGKKRAGFSRFFDGGGDEVSEERLDGEWNDGGFDSFFLQPSSITPLPHAVSPPLPCGLAPSVFESYSPPYVRV